MIQVQLWSWMLFLQKDGDLKDGQIAEVMSDSYAGRIIQRYKDNAVTIGQSSGHGWSMIDKNTLQVRILEDGELMEIFNNK